MDKKIFKSSFDGALELCNDYTATENILTAGNSFFEQSYFGVRILIIANKPGDEILIAGNSILTFAKAKAEIFIAYAVREKINLAAMKIFGIHKDKIIFVKNPAHLDKIISELRANVIFCTDDKIIEKVLRMENYRPEIYVSLADKNMPPDFYAPNILSVPKPNDLKYSWKNRVRFPVSESCQQPLMKENILAQAIFSYKNFRDDLNALKILNGDEIFFERRTDNQIYSAIKNIVGDKIIFEWREEIQVQRIAIYGENSCAIKISCELDNGANYRLEKILPATGLLIIDTEKIFVKRAEIIGAISDIEFFANAEPVRKIQPFIKMTVGKNFFYKYDVPAETENISVGVYKFHVGEPVKIIAESGDDNILTEILSDDEILNLEFGALDEIILTAEVIGNANIYDRAIIRKVGDLAQIQMKIFQWLDKINI